MSEVVPIWIGAKTPFNEMAKKARDNFQGKKYSTLIYTDPINPPAYAFGMVKDDKFQDINFNKRDYNTATLNITGQYFLKAITRINKYKSILTQKKNAEDETTIYKIFTHQIDKENEIRPNFVTMETIETKKEESLEFICDPEHLTRPAIKIPTNKEWGKKLKEEYLSRENQ